MPASRDLNKVLCEQRQLEEAQRGCWVMQRAPGPRDLDISAAFWLISAGGDPGHGRQQRASAVGCLPLQCQSCEPGRGVRWLQTRLL